MRDEVIEVMKALCIMGIVLLHAIFIQFGENNLLSNVLRLVAVNGFWILSGYVIYGKLKDSWIAEKIIRRIPLLIIFAVIYWVWNYYIVGIDGGQKLTINLGQYFAYNIGTGFQLTVLWYVWGLILSRVRFLDYILFGGTDIPIKISNMIGGWYAKEKI